MSDEPTAGDVPTSGSQEESDSYDGKTICKLQPIILLFWTNLISFSNLFQKHQTKS